MLRHGDEKDLEQVKKLSDHLFGDPYISTEEYLELLKIGYLFVAEEDGEIQAASLHHLITPKELSDEMAVTPEMQKDLCKERPALHFRYHAVYEEHTGKGIGSSLLAYALQEMKEDNKYGSVFTQLWVPLNRNMKEKQPMEFLAEKLGFSKLHEQGQPWQIEKYKHSYCPVCGGWCRCNARVYYREL